MTVPARGRPGAVLIMSVERQLTAEDLFDLETEPSELVAMPMVKRLKASHHATARHLASGRSVIETAELVGYSPQRVSDLQTKDPAFQNLLRYYKDQIAEAGISDGQRVQAKLALRAEQALDLLGDRLDAAEEGLGDPIPTGELRQIVTTGFDRTIAPPKQSVPGSNPPVQVTFNMGPRDIRRERDTKEIDKFLDDHEGEQIT